MTLRQNDHERRETLTRQIEHLLTIATNDTVSTRTRLEAWELIESTSRKLRQMIKD